MISFFPVVYPPIAPPSAFPRVPVIMSILPITPFSSKVPRPVSPINPAAWHSSIITIASYFSANSDILSKGATNPSIENTPSVTISLKRALFSSAAISCASKSAMLLFSYRYLAALHKRTPSIIEA